MKLSAGQPAERLPWFLWPLVPLFLPICIILMLPVGLLALLSMPFYLVFPDAHLHMYDLEGTARQRELLARWRAIYCPAGALSTDKARYQMLGTRACPATKEGACSKVLAFDAPSC